MSIMNWLKSLFLRAPAAGKSEPSLAASVKSKDAAVLVNLIQTYASDALHVDWMAAYGKQDYQQALSEINRVIENNPGQAEAYHHRAMTYYMLKQYDDALQDLGKTLEIDPNHLEAKLMQKFPEFGLVSEADAKRAKEHFERGKEYGKKKMFHKAIYEFTQAIELGPPYSEPHIMRGFTYYQIDENDKALWDYSAAISIDPRNPTPYVYRGMIISGTDMEKARADWRKALELDPTNQYARDMLRASGG